MRALCLLLAGCALACDVAHLVNVIADLSVHHTKCESFVPPSGCAGNRLVKLAIARECRRNSVVRDANLSGLAGLLDTVPPKRLATIEDLLPYITPWIIGEPEHALTVAQRPDQLQLDCTQSRYADALTGVPAETPSMIVDLVPIGYDIDLLEIHLLELYDVVDVFVLYESMHTQQGVHKPLYFNQSLSATPARWSRFAEKIIYMTPQRPPTAAELAAARRPSGRSWYLENQMRNDPIMQLRTSDHPLAVKARGQAHTALFLQHDGDEIPAAAAVLHLKACERKPSGAYYFPCTSYKLNTQWLQRTYDLAGLGRKWNPHATLDNYLWKAAPVALRFRDVLDAGTIDRGVVNAATPNLGPGAAVHFSSTAEPVGGWLKRVGVVEAFTSTELPSMLIDQIMSGSVNETYLRMLTDPWCNRDFHAVHVSTTGLADFLHESLPWAVRVNPHRYPFVYPPKDALHCSYRATNGDICAWSSAGGPSLLLKECQTYFK